VGGWRRRTIAGLMVVATALTSGCQYIPSNLPNPFRSEPTPTSAPAASPVPAAKASPEVSKPAFTPIWVKNHRITEMWSGPAGEPNVVSFGTTSAQFCSFQLVRPPDNPRVYVLNPYSNNYFWIDADAVGPIPNPPERRPGPKPSDQNCTDAIYEG
jgi:hypothetical protein